MNNKQFLVCGDKFLSQKTCDSLISFYKKNQKNKQFHPDNSSFYVKIKNNFRFFLLQQKIKKQIKSYTKTNVTIDEFQIVEWPENSKMEEHYDKKYNDFCSLIVYLNHNFYGGETIFHLHQKTMITPQTGRFVMFSNNNILHSVNEITSGTRYTLVCYTVKNKYVA